MWPDAGDCLSLRIFHYSPWYTYHHQSVLRYFVENLSLFALIYLRRAAIPAPPGWESFIIRLDILKKDWVKSSRELRIFHYSPWYTYQSGWYVKGSVENLSLFALIYLAPTSFSRSAGWESFIIRLDILTFLQMQREAELRIFHYSPWYT